MTSVSQNSMIQKRESLINTLASLDKKLLAKIDEIEEISDMLPTKREEAKKERQQRINKKQEEKSKLEKDIQNISQQIKNLESSKKTIEAQRSTLNAQKKLANSALQKANTDVKEKQKEISALVSPSRIDNAERSKLDGMKKRLDEQIPGLIEIKTANLEKQKELKNKYDKKMSENASQLQALQRDLSRKKDNLRKAKVEYNKAKANVDSNSKKLESNMMSMRSRQEALKSKSSRLQEMKVKLNSNTVVVNNEQLKLNNAMKSETTQQEQQQGRNLSQSLKIANDELQTLLSEKNELGSQIQNLSMKIQKANDNIGKYESLKKIKESELAPLEKYRSNKSLNKNRINAELNALKNVNDDSIAKLSTLLNEKTQILPGVEEELNTISKETSRLPLENNLNRLLNDFDELHKTFMMKRDEMVELKRSRGYSRKDRTPLKFYTQNILPILNNGRVDRNKFFKSPKPPSTPPSTNNSKKPPVNNSKKPPVNNSKKPPVNNSKNKKNELSNENIIKKIDRELRGRSAKNRNAMVRMVKNGKGKQALDRLRVKISQIGK